MKAQISTYNNVGKGGSACLSSLCFAFGRYAPIAKRSFAKKFLQAFFKKPKIKDCSPFFSWFGSFLCVTTKKRSYSLCYYLYYMLSYYLSLYLILSLRALASVGFALKMPACRRFQSPCSARNPPACIFAGGFRSRVRQSQRGLFLQKTTIGDEFAVVDGSLQKCRNAQKNKINTNKIYKS